MSASEASIATSSSSTDNNAVTFTFSSATIGSAGVFYLPLATGSYTNLTVAVTCNDATQTVNYGDLTINRCDVKAIALTTNDDGNLMYIEKLEDNKYKINGHVFVDLGLSVVWAETNIGATSSTEAGDYFAWGETTTKSDYANNTYTSSLTSKYLTNGGKTTLEAEDDAATVYWGASCRMPTKAECEELLSSSNCTWASENGGYTVTNVSKKSSIFLPYTGYYNGSSLENKGNNGYFWMSTVADVSKQRVDRLYITTKDSKYYWWDSEPYFGYTVRPVVTLPSK